MKKLIRKIFDAVSNVFSILIGVCLLLISLILFPIVGLIALTIKSVVSILILPAQILKFDWLPTKPPENRPHFTVETKDGAQLDTVEILQHPKTSEKQNYLIYFCGNGMSHREALETLEEFSHEISVIGFDYKGVNQSTGKTLNFSDLLKAGQAQVQRLLDKGVPSQSIVLYGVSLGGAVATTIAADLHKQNFPVYCANVVSFSSVSRVVEKNFLEAFEKAVGSVKLVSTLWAPFIKKVLSLLNWEYDIAKAYNEIPNYYKGHIYLEEDKVVPYEASLDEALKRRFPENNEAGLGRAMWGKYGHNTPPDMLKEIDPTISRPSLLKDLIVRMRDQTEQDIPKIPRIQLKYQQAAFSIFKRSASPYPVETNLMANNACA